MWTACSTMKSPDRLRRPSHPPWPRSGPLLLVQAARASMSVPSWPLWMRPSAPSPEPGVGSALKTDVKGKIRMRRGFTDQAVAAGKRQGQGLLGVEAFARSQHVAGEGLVQVTRDGENDGVDIPAGSRMRRGSSNISGAPALCLLDDSLAAPGGAWARHRRPP